MLIQIVLFQILSIILLGSVGHAQFRGFENPNYSFKADGINIEPWNRNDLTVEQGLLRIANLDQWFSKLSQDNKQKQAMNYALNRNRLFLVAQEKRLANELAEMTLHEASSGDITKAKADLELIRKSETSLLNDRYILTSQLIKNLDEVGQVYYMKNPAEGAIGFSVALSKSGDGSSGGAFWGSGSEREKSLADRIDPLNLRQKWKDYQAEKKNNSTERKVDRIVFNSNFLQCAPLDAKKENPLDTQKFPRSAGFLKQLGISDWNETTKSRDLSHWYGPHETQIEKGEPNAKCMALAIASDMRMVFNRTHPNRNVRVSSDQTYALLTRVENAEVPYKTQDGDYCNLTKYRVDPLRGIESLSGSLSILSKQPACAATSSQHDPAGLYAVKKFNTLEFDSKSKEPLSFEFFKALIDRGNPPIVGLSSNARTVTGDWVHIARGGQMKHMINVVGYGEDTDPQTLCKVKYFNVRDGLSPKGYAKIPASNLLEHLVGVYKINEVDEIRRGSDPAVSAPRKDESIKGVRSVR